MARSSSDESEASSYNERVTHTVMKIAEPTGTHTFFAEAAMRDLFPATGGLRFPSLEIQQARLSSIKTSFKYNFAWAANFAPLLARRGNGASVSARGGVECAGLLGDAHFIRGEAQIGASCGLPWQLLWHATGSCGLLLPTDGRPSCFQDRFFLGGASGSAATVLKGFAHRGVGQVGASRLRDEKKPAKRLTDSLGGDAMFNVFTAVSGPVVIPYGDGEAVNGRGFAFLGIGALAPSSYVGARGLLRGARSSASVGLGFGFPLAGLGTLEITVANPIWQQSHDVCQRWQLGLRLDVRGA